MERKLCMKDHNRLAWLQKGKIIDTAQAIQEKRNNQCNKRKQNCDCYAFLEKKLLRDKIAKEKQREKEIV